MQRFQRDREAVTQVFAFMVAGILFIAVMAAVLFAGRGMGGDTEPLDSAQGSSRSSSLADLLVSSRGIGWEGGADGLVRLGLLAENGSGLDAEHLELLRGGSYSADSNNGLLDYEEAKASLGLGDDIDFHMRIGPIALREVLLQTDLSHLRTAYIGDWDSLGSTTVDLSTGEQMRLQVHAQLDSKMGVLTPNERQMVVDLGLSFENQVHIALGAPSLLVDMPLPLPDTPLLEVLGIPLWPGDVYPDRKEYLDQVFPSRLDQYHVLVVGSQVDQKAMTSDSIKFAVRDWVLGGGTLIVLGSDSQNFQWMQPIMSLGTTTTVNGGAYANDPSHPLLWQPDPLDWASYDNHGLGWDIKSQGSGAHYDDFQHIVQEDGRDVLAVSLEGAFGEGRIFLSTFRPHEIAESHGLQEAMNFVRNMILYSERAELYLDYGPAVPDDASIQVGVRQSHLWDSQIGQVPVRIEVLTWTA